MAHRIMSEQRTTADGGMETSYGFREVGAGEKQPLVNDVFHKVANRYDLMNDLMSAGCTGCGKMPWSPG